MPKKEKTILSVLSLAVSTTTISSSAFLVFYCFFINNEVLSDKLHAISTSPHLYLRLCSLSFHNLRCHFKLHFFWLFIGFFWCGHFIKISPSLLQNLQSDLSLWQLGTLPPSLIAFHGYVHIIDPFWHMLGLGYQDNTHVSEAKEAAVIHFNGRAKPWLEIGFPHLRPLWTKYIDTSDKFIKICKIAVS